MSRDADGGEAIKLDNRSIHNAEFPLVVIAIAVPAIGDAVSHL